MVGDDVRLFGPAVPGNRWDRAPEEPGPTGTPRVSVVVSHYEQPRQLARTLRALAGQRYDGEVEVVVADDGSRTAPQVPSGVRLVVQEHRGFGVARARNAGRRAASGEVLVFLDADTTPEPDFVAAVSALPRRLPEALVTGRRRHADLASAGPDEPVAVAGPRLELTEPAWLAEAYARTEDLLLADETSFRFLIGAVLCCGADLFDETGGFDESFTAYGGEDWEWAYRAWTRGALLAHQPQAVAWHDGPYFSERETPDPVARLRAETLAVATRVPVPGVAPRGLLTAGAADPLVTLNPAVGGDALVVVVDDLLAALPRARVLLDAERLAALPLDPRLGQAVGDPLEAPEARTAWRRLHVVRPARGPGAAWTVPGDLLAGVGAPGRVEVVDGDGGALAVWSTLRAERRERRWGRPLDPCARVVGDLEPLPGDLPLQAHWGGWR